MRSFEKLFALCLVGLATVAAPLIAQSECAPFLSGYGLQQSGIIGLDVQPGLSVSTANDAIGYWQNGCQGQYGNSFASFTTSGAWDILGTVHFTDGPSTNSRGSCATTFPVYVNGILQRFDIELFNTDREGFLCTPSDSLAHELGHVLGLGDAEPSACDGSIMGAPIFGPRDVLPDDCNTADMQWYTSSEYDHDHPPPPYCDGSCPYPCEHGVCPVSPILIDLDGEGYELGSLLDPVGFDLNGDGTLDQVSWTRGGTKVGLLCVDLNGNGKIDSGRELFGTSTLWPVSHLPTPNGFEALALYDSPSVGGNGDRTIDSRDGWFARLRVWVDGNHNGVSEPAEILTLADAGIVSIDLSYSDSRRRDRYGNIFRYKGKAVLRDGRGRLRERIIWDVFFEVAH